MTNYLINYRRTRIPGQIPGVSPQAYPFILAGYVGWWDAAQLTGLNDGDACASFTDQSGSNYHLAQTTASKKPLYKTNIINGYPALLFDGINDFMQVSFTLNQPATYFVVIKRALNASFQKCFIDGASSNSASLWFQALTTLRLYSGSGITGTVTDNGNPHIYTTVINGASSYVYEDSTQVIAGNPGANNLGGISIGTFGDGNVDYTFDGYIAEVVAYSSALTGTDRAVTETYLKNKYQIA